MRRAILPALGTAALAAVLAACGSSGTAKGGGLPLPPPGTSAKQPVASDTGSTGGSSAAPAASDSACQPTSVITFCETINITGAFTVSGTGAGIPELDHDAGLKLTCATWANNHPENPDYPQLQVPNDPVGGHKLRLNWRFPAGAGVTDIAKYAGSNDISVDDKGFQDVAVDVNNTTASSGNVEVKPDGSGSLTFKDLASADGKVSGSITWTCVDIQQ